MRWWACDNGHANEIPDNTTLKVMRTRCPSCIDGAVYRVDIYDGHLVWGRDTDDA